MKTGSSPARTAGLRCLDGCAVRRVRPPAASRDRTGRRRHAGIRRTLQPLEIGAQFGRALISRLAILLERLEDDVIELRRNAGLDLRRRRRRLGQQAFENRRDRRALERQLAGRPFRTARRLRRTDRCAHRSPGRAPVRATCTTRCRSSCRWSSTDRSRRSWRRGHRSIGPLRSAWRRRSRGP